MRSRKIFCISFTKQVPRLHPCAGGRGCLCRERDRGRERGYTIDCIAYERECR